MAPQEEITVSPITAASDFTASFHVLCEAFGRQTNDAIWTGLFPDWDTPTGKNRNVSRIVKRWQSVTTNRNGYPNTVFLKATVSTVQEDGRVSEAIAGYAVWDQLSVVEGWGNPPTDSTGLPSEALLSADVRFGTQMFQTMVKRRIEFVKEKKDANPPAIFVLDICAVDPAYQRRGIAGKLVEWGLEEAKRRGGLECTTEGSAMGRAVYRRLGFKDEGHGDIAYTVDEEFKGRYQPPNVFLRTGLS